MRSRGMVLGLTGLCIVVATSLGQAAETPTVDSLMKMDKSARMAKLKELSPEARRGLWLSVKRAERGGQTHAIYSQMKPTTHVAATSASSTSSSSARMAHSSSGTIRYDSGSPTRTYSGGAIVGNRFDSALGAPLTSSMMVGTVQAVVKKGAAQTTSSAGFVLLGPQTANGGANALFSSFDQASGATDTVTFTGMSVNLPTDAHSFYVLFGDFANSYVPAFGTETNSGQGHHGVVGYTGGMGPNITGTFNLGGTQNAFVRATGLLLPVELTKFRVE